MRNAAEKVYTDYRQPFLDTIKGALTKDLLLREEDVQVLHGFDSAAHAKAYLSSAMFQNDVFVGYPLERRAGGQDLHRGLSRQGAGGRTIHAI